MAEDIIHEHGFSNIIWIETKPYIKVTSKTKFFEQLHDELQPRSFITYVLHSFWNLKWENLFKVFILYFVENKNVGMIRFCKKNVWDRLKFVIEFFFSQGVEGCRCGILITGEIWFVKLVKNKKSLTNLFMRCGFTNVNANYLRIMDALQKRWRKGIGIETLET